MESFIITIEFSGESKRPNSKWSTGRFLFPLERSAYGSSEILPIDSSPLSTVHDSS